MASVEASTASCMVIPAPSAFEEVSPLPKLRVMFLSATSRLVVLIVVVVPETVRSPEIVALPVIATPVEVVSNFCCYRDKALQHHSDCRPAYFHHLALVTLHKHL